MMHAIVSELRNSGRELVAEDVLAILHNIQEDPDEPEVKPFSLQSMARFLIAHSEFADPVVGVDPSGVMQVEWRIDGNGLLVMAFLEDDKVHVVAQANETFSCRALNESVLLSA